MKVAALIAATAVAWVVAGAAAAGLDGPAHWLPSGVAAGLCLVPAVGTMLAVRGTENRSPVEAIGAILVAPIVRLVVVLLGGAALWRLVPDFQDAPGRFWGWVLGFYLFTLIAETALLLSRPGRQPGTQQAPGGA